MPIPELTPDKIRELNSTLKSIQSDKDSPRILDEMINTAHNQLYNTSDAGRKMYFDSYIANDPEKAGEYISKMFPDLSGLFGANSFVSSAVNNMKTALTHDPATLNKIFEAEKTAQDALAEQNRKRDLKWERGEQITAEDEPNELIRQTLNTTIDARLKAFDYYQDNPNEWSWENWKQGIVTTPQTLNDVKPYDRKVIDILNNEFGFGITQNKNVIDGSIFNGLEDKKATELFKGIVGIQYKFDANRLQNEATKIEESLKKNKGLENEYKKEFEKLLQENPLKPLDITDSVGKTEVDMHNSLLNRAKFNVDNKVAKGELQVAPEPLTLADMKVVKDRMAKDLFNKIQGDDWVQKIMGREFFFTPKIAQVEKVFEQYAQLEKEGKPFTMENVKTDLANAFAIAEKTLKPKRLYDYGIDYYAAVADIGVKFGIGIVLYPDRRISSNIQWAGYLTYGSTWLSNQVTGEDNNYGISEALMNLGNEKLAENYEASSKFQDWLDVGSVLEKIGIKDKDRIGDFGSSVAQGIGSTVGFMLLSAVGMAFGLPPVAVSGLVGAITEGESYSKEIWDKTKDVNKTSLAYGIGLFSGSTEALGYGSVLKNWEKLTGGTIKQLVVGTIKEGIEEATQEIFQTGIESFASQYLFDDKYRDAWKETLEAGASAFWSSLMFSGAAGTGRAGQRTLNISNGQNEVIKRLTSQAVHSPIDFVNNISNMNKLAQEDDGEVQTQIFKNVLKKSKLDFNTDEGKSNLKILIDKLANPVDSKRKVKDETPRGITDLSKIADTPEYYRVMDILYSMSQTADATEVQDFANLLITSQGYDVADKETYKKDKDIFAINETFNKQIAPLNIKANPNSSLITNKDAVSHLFEVFNVLSNYHNAEERKPIKKLLKNLANELGMNLDGRIVGQQAKYNSDGQLITLYNNYDKLTEEQKSDFKNALKSNGYEFEDKGKGIIVPELDSIVDAHLDTVEKLGFKERSEPPKSKTVKETEAKVGYKKVGDRIIAIDKNGFAESEYQAMAKLENGKKETMDIVLRRNIDAISAIATDSKEGEAGIEIAVDSLVKTYFTSSQKQKITSEIKAIAKENISKEEKAKKIASYLNDVADKIEKFKNPDAVVNDGEISIEEYNQRVKANKPVKEDKKKKTVTQVKEEKKDKIQKKGDEEIKQLKAKKVELESKIEELTTSLTSSSEEANAVLEKLKDPSKVEGVVNKAKKKDKAKANELKKAVESKKKVDEKIKEAPKNIAKEKARATRDTGTYKKLKEELGDKLSAQVIKHVEELVKYLTDEQIAQFYSTQNAESDSLVEAFSREYIIENVEKLDGTSFIREDFDVPSLSMEEKTSIFEDKVRNKEVKGKERKGKELAKEIAKQEVSKEIKAVKNKKEALNKEVKKAGLGKSINEAEKILKNKIAKTEKEQIIEKEIQDVKSKEGKIKKQEGVLPDVEEKKRKISKSKLVKVDVKDKGIIRVTEEEQAKADEWKEEIDDSDTKTIEDVQKIVATIPTAEKIEEQEAEVEVKRGEVTLDKVMNKVSALYINFKELFGTESLEELTTEISIALSKPNEEGIYPAEYFDYSADDKQLEMAKFYAQFEEDLRGFTIEQMVETGDNVLFNLWELASKRGKQSNKAVVNASRRLENVVNRNTGALQDTTDKDTIDKKVGLFFSILLMLHPTVKLSEKEETLGKLVDKSGRVIVTKQLQKLGLLFDSLLNSSLGTTYDENRDKLRRSLKEGIRAIAERLVNASQEMKDYYKQAISNFPFANIVNVELEKVMWSLTHDNKEKYDMVIASYEVAKDELNLLNERRVQQGKKPLSISDWKDKGRVATEEKRFREAQNFFKNQLEYTDIITAEVFPKEVKEAWESVAFVTINPELKKSILKMSPKQFANWKAEQLNGVEGLNVAWFTNFEVQYQDLIKQKEQATTTEDKQNIENQLMQLAIQEEIDRFAIPVIEKDSKFNSDEAYTVVGKQVGKEGRFAKYTIPNKETFDKFINVINALVVRGDYGFAGNALEILRQTKFQFERDIEEGKKFSTSKKEQSELIRTKAEMMRRLINMNGNSVRASGRYQIKVKELESEIAREVDEKKREDLIRQKDNLKEMLSLAGIRIFEDQQKMMNALTNILSERIETLGSRFGAKDLFDVLKPILQNSRGKVTYLNVFQGQSKRSGRLKVEFVSAGSGAVKGEFINFSFYPKDSVSGRYTDRAESTFMITNTNGHIGIKENEEVYKGIEGIDESNYSDGKSVPIAWNIIDDRYFQIADSRKKSGKSPITITSSLENEEEIVPKVVNEEEAIKWEEDHRIPEKIEGHNSIGKIGDETYRAEIIRLPIGIRNAWKSIGVLIRNISGKVAYEYKERAGGVSEIPLDSTSHRMLQAYNFMGDLAHLTKKQIGQNIETILFNLGYITRLIEEFNSGALDANTQRVINKWFAEVLPEFKDLALKTINDIQKLKEYKDNKVAYDELISKVYQGTATANQLWSNPMDYLPNILKVLPNTFAFFNTKTSEYEYVQDGKKVIVPMEQIYDIINNNFIDTVINDRNAILTVLMNPAKRKFIIDRLNKVEAKNLEGKDVAQFEKNKSLILQRIDKNRQRKAFKDNIKDRLNKIIEDNKDIPLEDNADRIRAKQRIEEAKAKEELKINSEKGKSVETDATYFEYGELKYDEQGKVIISDEEDANVVIDAINEDEKIAENEVVWKRERTKRTTIYRTGGGWTIESNIFETRSGKSGKWLVSKNEQDKETFARLEDAKEFVKEEIRKENEVEVVENKITIPAIMPEDNRVISKSKKNHWIDKQDRREVVVGKSTVTVFVGDSATGSPLIELSGNISIDKGKVRIKVEGKTVFLWNDIDAFESETGMKLKQEKVVTHEAKGKLAQLFDSIESIPEDIKKVSRHLVGDKADKSLLFFIATDGNVYAVNDALSIPKGQGFYLVSNLPIFTDSNDLLWTDSAKTVIERQGLEAKANYFGYVSISPNGTVYHLEGNQNLFTIAEVKENSTLNRLAKDQNRDAFLKALKSLGYKINFLNVTSDKGESLGQDIIERDRKTDEFIKENITEEEIAEISKEENIPSEQVVAKVTEGINNQLIGKKSVGFGKALKRVIDRIMKLFLVAGIVLTFSTAIYNNLSSSVISPEMIGNKVSENSSISDKSRNDLSVVGKMAYDNEVKNNQPFILIDKPTAMGYVYDENGWLIKSFPVLLGKGIGDGINTADASASSVSDSLKVTTAGRYKLYMDNERVRKIWNNRILSFVNGDGLAIHETYTEELEARTQALESPTVKDNRMSWGCVNVSGENFDAYITPNISAGNYIIVTPDNQEDYIKNTKSLGQSLEGIEKGDTMILNKLLNKAFPNVEVIELSDAEFIAKFGKSYFGDVQQDAIYINKDRAKNKNTRLHEYSHIVFEWLKQNRPEIYDKLVEELDKMNETELAKQTLSDYSEYQYHSEMFAKMMESRDIPMNKFTLKIREIWQDFLRFLGIKYIDQLNIEDATLPQLMNALGKDMLKGFTSSTIRQVTERADTPTTREDHYKSMRQLGKNFREVLKSDHKRFEFNKIMVRRIFGKIMPDFNISFIKSDKPFFFSMGDDYITMNEQFAHDTIPLSMLGGIFVKWAKKNDTELYNLGKQIVKNDNSLAEKVFLIRPELRLEYENATTDKDRARAEDDIVITALALSFADEGKLAIVTNTIMRRFSKKFAGDILTLTKDMKVKDFISTIVKRTMDSKPLTTMRNSDVALISPIEKDMPSHLFDADISNYILSNGVHGESAQEFYDRVRYAFGEDNYVVKQLKKLLFNKEGKAKVEKINKDYLLDMSYKIEKESIDVLNALNKMLAYKVDWKEDIAIDAYFYDTYGYDSFDILTDPVKLDMIKEINFQDYLLLLNEQKKEMIDNMLPLAIEDNTDNHYFDYLRKEEKEALITVLMGQDYRDGVEYGVIPEYNREELYNLFVQRYNYSPIITEEMWDVVLNGSKSELNKNAYVLMKSYGINLEYNRNALNTYALQRDLKTKVEQLRNWGYQSKIDLETDDMGNLTPSKQTVKENLDSIIKNLPDESRQFVETLRTFKKIDEPRALELLTPYIARAFSSILGRDVVLSEKANQYVFDAIARNPNRTLYKMNKPIQGLANIDSRSKGGMTDFSINLLKKQEEETKTKFFNKGSSSILEAHLRAIELVKSGKITQEYIDKMPKYGMNFAGEEAVAADIFVHLKLGEAVKEYFDMRKTVAGSQWNKDRTLLALKKVVDARINDLKKIRTIPSQAGRQVKMFDYHNSPVQAIMQGILDNDDIRKEAMSVIPQEFQDFLAQMNKNEPVIQDIFSSIFYSCFFNITSDVSNTLGNTVTLMGYLSARMGAVSDWKYYKEVMKPTVLAQIVKSAVVRTANALRGVTEEGTKWTDKNFDFGNIAKEWAGDEVIKRLEKLGVSEMKQEKTANIVRTTINTLWAFFPLRRLSAEDAFFREIIEQIEYKVNVQKGKKELAKILGNEGIVLSQAQLDLRYQNIVDAKMEDLEGIDQSISLGLEEGKNFATELLLQEELKGAFLLLQNLATKLSATDRSHNIAYQALQAVVYGIVKLAVPIFRILVNGVKMSMKYSMFGAPIRLGMGVFGKGGNTEIQRLKAMNFAERSNYIRTAVFGNLMFTALLGLVASGCQITGDMSYDKRVSASESSGGLQPNSLYCGDYHMSYNTISQPFPFLFSSFGNIMDTMHYSKIKVEKDIVDAKGNTQKLTELMDKPLDEWLLDTGIKIGQTFFKTAEKETGVGMYIDLVNSFTGNTVSKNGGADHFKIWLGRIMGRPFAGASAMMDIYDQMFVTGGKGKERYKAEGFEDAFAYAIGANKFANNPILSTAFAWIPESLKTMKEENYVRDAFGDKVPTYYSRVPMIFRNDSDKTDPVSRLMMEKSYWISSPSEETKLGDTKMTPEQYNEYATKSGQIAKKIVKDNIDYLKTVSPEDFKDFVKLRIIDVVRDEYKQVMVANIDKAKGKTIDYVPDSQTQWMQKKFGQYAQFYEKSLKGLDEIFKKHPVYSVGQELEAQREIAEIEAQRNKATTQAQMDYFDMKLENAKNKVYKGKYVKGLSENQYKYTPTDYEKYDWMAVDGKRLELNLGGGTDINWNGIVTTRKGLLADSMEQLVLVNKALNIMDKGGNLPYTYKELLEKKEAYQQNIKNIHLVWQEIQAKKNELNLAILTETEMERQKGKITGIGKKYKESYLRQLDKYGGVQINTDKIKVGD